MSSGDSSQLSAGNMWHFCLTLLLCCLCRSFGDDLMDGGVSLLSLHVWAAAPAGGGGGAAATGGRRGLHSPFQMNMRMVMTQ